MAVFRRRRDPVDEFAIWRFLRHIAALVSHLDRGAAGHGQLLDLTLAPVAPGVIPFWSPDSRTLYYARFQEGSADASILMRQPLDPATGRPSVPATEFYRFAGSLDDPILNTITASRTNLYTLLRGGMSEIWMMDLPE
jgi:hypothetical protein